MSNVFAKGLVSNIRRSTCRTFGIRLTFASVSATGHEALPAQAIEHSCVNGVV
jgi:hypothetical protein